MNLCDAFFIPKYPPPPFKPSEQKPAQSQQNNVRITAYKRYFADFEQVFDYWERPEMTFLDDLESKKFFAPQPWWAATFRHLRLTSLKSCIRPWILYIYLKICRISGRN